MIKEVDFNKDLTEEEERWIVDHLDEFKPAPEWVGKSLREAAKNPPIIERSNKTNHESMDLSFVQKNDLTKLKNEAHKQGITCQTLIANIIHKYLESILVDANEAKS